MNAILEILGKIGFDWQIALANFINFLIIFYLLKRFAWGPIQRTLDERRKKIDDGIENARKAETELLMAKKEGEKIVNEHKDNANKILAQAKEQEKKMINQASILAIEEKEKIIKDAHRQIEDDREKMSREVTEKSADLVISGIEKILKQKVDRKKDESLIKQMIS
jgi:F-type H+-transporting ATPase subunit b